MSSLNIPPLRDIDTLSISENPDWSHLIESTSQPVEKKGLAKYEHLRITAEKVYPNNEATITWNDESIASPGNVTGISAPPKAGKTAVTSILAAGAITLSEVLDGFSPIKVRQNTSRFAVINMDTEQSEYDQQYNVKTTIRKAGLESTPNYLLNYNIRQLPMSDFEEVTSYVCDAASEEFGGIHSIFIDGGADYIRSANDEEKSSEIIQYFTHLAIKHNCPVILVVHTNPNTEKERGHFGSYLQRKCYAILTIEMRDGMSILKGKATRKAGDFDPIHFKYDKEKGYHVQIDATDKTIESNQKQLDKIRKIVTEALTLPGKYKYNEAVKRIMKAGNIASDRTAKNHIGTAVAHDFLIHEGDDYFVNH